MFTPPVDILVFLTVTFLLGLTLGWIIWKFQTVPEDDGSESEVQFWKQRFNQSRLEHGVEQSKVGQLEKELEALRAAS